MSPDAIFFDEASANLDAMDAILARTGAAADPDGVHALFRHAHSIKGGAAAFDLAPVVELMHLIESVLEKSRVAGVLPDGASADLLREGVLAARQMLADDGTVDGIALAPDLAQRLREGALAPRAAPQGVVRRIVVRSPEKAVVLSAIKGLFVDIAGLGELLSAEAGADGTQVFVVRATVGDDALLDLLAMHVARGKVSIGPVEAMPTAPPAVVRAGEVPAVAAGASVRVDADALHRLAVLARELVHAAPTAGVCADGAQARRREQDLQRLCRGVEDLARAPVSVLFARLPPVLQRLSQQLGKVFDLSVSGADVRIDRVVLQRLVDPFMHLVRNACDHGIEPAEQRLVAGKRPAGRIAVSASSEPGRVSLSVRDDGAGLSREGVLQAARARGMALPAHMDDQAVWRLVFAPGLSTVAAPGLVSGRGVGMDVVQRQVHALGGEVAIASSPGAGVCVTISLPQDEAVAAGAAGQRGAG